MTMKTVIAWHHKDTVVNGKTPVLFSLCICVGNVLGKKLNSPFIFSMFRHNKYINNFHSQLSVFVVIPSLFTQSFRLFGCNIFSYFLHPPEYVV